MFTYRQMVNTIIRRTLIEVAESGAWSEVKKGVEQLRQKDCDVTSLRLTNKQLRASRDAIINELDEKRDQWVTELKDADEKVAILRDKTSDDLQNANARLCYAEKWLFARFEALELRLNVPRPPPPRSDHEQRVHEELLKAFELQIQYDLHAGEIRGWLTFKRERAARLAREQQLRASATHIQAWWRGIMVRKALGQFRYLRQTKGKGKKK
ncbi:unnamed protein product [Chrysodeixis includens]|uniref:Dynein regulatory complex protein 9 n=1 Tax=Chrysodeixis includens TaxID=689277 RepID=A0A9P0BYQ4_CHRIL|nr:unnamed protein product [Chrysodeixis includens]